MKSNSRLFLVSLVPCLSITTTALSHETGDGIRPHPGGAYADHAMYSNPYATYPGHPADFGASGDVYAPKAAPAWAHESGWRDPNRPESDSYRVQSPAGGYRPYPAPDGQPGSQWDPVAQPSAPNLGDSAYWGQVGNPSALPSAPAGGYRFRGDGPKRSGGWGETAGRDGFRFRPLSQQERQRMDVGTGWRPRVPDRIGKRPRQQGSLPTKETYGYQPDSWFRRYYGVQP